MEQTKLRGAWTAPVDCELVDRCVQAGILPVFVSRDLRDHPVYGRFAGTSVHIPELAPSQSLWKDFRYTGVLTVPEFNAEYARELGKRISVQGIVDRVALMMEVCQATGVVLVGPDYREVIGEVLSRYTEEGRVLEMSC